MEQMAANAQYARLHEKAPWHDGSFEDWSEHPSEEFPYRFDFGVTIGVADTDLRPDDQFLSGDLDDDLRAEPDEAAE